jgi:hypothetical protein
MMAASMGRLKLAVQPIIADQIIKDGMTARIAFSSATPLPRVEVILVVEDELKTDIAGVEIFGELVDPEKWRLEITDLPTPRVENVVRKGRNLFEGYQRGLAIASPDQRARIASDPDFRRARELAGDRTIVGEANLGNIFLIMKFFATKLPAGHIVEFGSYKGGSAIFMAALAERFLPAAQVIGFDTFAGMPQTDQVVDEHRAGDFASVDLDELHQYVERIGLKNLSFVKGRFESSAHSSLEKLKSVIFCHIDCDIRSSIEYAYGAARRYMAPGGYWVFDDLLVASCLGAAEAVEDLLTRRDGLNSEQLFPHCVYRQPYAKTSRAAQANRSLASFAKKLVARQPGLSGGRLVETRENLVG